MACRGREGERKDKRREKGDATHVVVQFPPPVPFCSPDPEDDGCELSNMIKSVSFASRRGRKRKEEMERRAELTSDNDRSRRGSYRNTSNSLHSFGARFQ